jgi:hypothetical protein
MPLFSLKFCDSFCITPKKPAATYAKSIANLCKIDRRATGPDGIILSVTGYVASPRMVGSTKSDLLFNILKLLRAHNVNLSSPQEVVFMKHREKSLVDEEEHSS